MAAAAAAGRPVQLLRLGHVDLGLPPPGAVSDVDVETLVAMGVASLEAVYVTVGGNVDDGEPDSQAEVGQPKEKKKKKKGNHVSSKGRHSRLHPLASHPLPTIGCANGLAI
jgi:hypothetical protein